MSRSVLVILVVIAALVALLLAVPRGGAGPGDGTPEGAVDPRPPAPPTLKGAGTIRPEPTASDGRAEPGGDPEADRGILRGIVRSRDGSPLRQPRIYLLPKTLGGDHQVAVSTRADDEGRWRLEGADPRGHWIGARTKHHRPAFFDGDLWAGEEIELVVEPGRVVTVQVRRPNGRVPPGALIAATPPRRSGAFPFPGPGRRVSFNHSEPVLGKDAVTITLPTNGPVLLRPRVPRHVVVPTERVLQIETPEASFQAVPACRLDVEVTDAETEARIDGKIRIVLLSLATGRQVLAVDSREALKAWMDQHGLSPGAYTLLVERAGYHRFAKTPVHFDEPGQKIEVDAPLTLDAAAGRLEVQLSVPEGTSLERKLLVVLAQTRDPDTHEATPWRRLYPRAVDGEAARLLLGPLQPGDWDLLIWVGARLVGRGEAVVRGGSPDHARVTVGPGLVADFGRWDHPDRPRGDSDEDWFVHLQTEGRRALPGVRFQSRQRFVVGIGGGGAPSDVVRLGLMVPPHAVLGPYPYDTLRVIRVGDDPPRPWIVRAE